MEEIAVDRHGGAGGERSGEHDRSGPRHRSFVGRHEPGQLIRGDRRGIFHELRRPPHGIVEERRAAAGVGDRRHGDKIDTETGKLRRRPRRGRPAEERHRPTDSPERPNRYGDIEHLAAGTAVHVAGPIHFPGLE